MGRGQRKYTDEQLAEALGRSRTMRELLMALGLLPRGGNYETVRRRIAELGLDASHLRTYGQGRGLRGCSDEEVTEAVRTSRSLAQVLARLGLPRGGNQARLKARITALGLDTSHLSGQGWRRGTREPVVAARRLSEILVVGKLAKTSQLRLRLVAEGSRSRGARSAASDPGMASRSHWSSIT